MLDSLKRNWFVVLVALVIIGFVCYYVVDSTKDNVTVKSSNGQDVIASIKGADITAEDLYEKGEPLDSALLYNLYKNAVVDQSVKTTEDLEQLAKSNQNAIIQNAKSQSANNYEDILAAELASYGYADYDDLYDYCLCAAKENKLDEDYVKNHFDELKEGFKDVNPKVISVITMNVANPEELTDAEKKKQENIDKEIEDSSFAKAATAFSDDTQTAPYDGVLGYVDNNSTSVSADIIEAIKDKKAGEVTDWIQVTDSQTGSVALYKVKVDYAGIDDIYKNMDDQTKSSILNAFISYNPTLKIDAVEEAAKKLDITYENKETGKKIKEYVDLMIKQNQPAEESGE